MGHLALGGADLHLLSDVVGRLGRGAGRVLQTGRPDTALGHSRIAVWANRRIQDVLQLLCMRATSLGTSFAAATTSSTTAATAVAISISFAPLRFASALTSMALSSHALPLQISRIARGGAPPAAPC